MNRYHFIRTIGISLASLLTRNVLFANGLRGSTMNLPDEVTAVLDDRPVTLTGGGESWTYKDLTVQLVERGQALAVEVRAPGSRLTSVTLRWKQRRREDSKVLNDHWERTYGDVSWHALYDRFYMVGYLPPVVDILPRLKLRRRPLGGQK